jgi:HEAT repeat protein
MIITLQQFIAGYLLKGSIGKDFLTFMSPENLLIGVQIMAVCILLIIILIYAQLLAKKRMYFYTDRIRNNIEVWISHIILEESVDGIDIPKKFYRLLDDPKARQVAIDELTNCKKNFSGTVAENIVALYNKLGLREDSLGKMRNKRKWYVQARGIQELYLMDQKNLLTKIYRETNSKNEFVRSEAQIAIIYMTGFNGLRFLDVISYPLTLWQQIKLLEQLRLFGKKEDLSDRIPKWLQSQNETVVVFALRLAAEYQQYAVKDDILHCLVHPSDAVRTRAIKTLIVLADEQTPFLLTGYFSKENFDNQIHILNNLANMASDEQAPFLERLLDAPDNIIKLKAAVVLAGNCTNGMSVLEKRALLEPEPFERILKHVKSVK